MKWDEDAASAVATGMRARLLLLLTAPTQSRSSQGEVNVHHLQMVAVHDADVLMSNFKAETVS